MEEIYRMKCLVLLFCCLCQTPEFYLLPLSQEPEMPLTFSIAKFCLVSHNFKGVPIKAVCIADERGLAWWSILAARYRRCLLCCASQILLCGLQIAKAIG